MSRAMRYHRLRPPPRAMMRWHRPAAMPPAPPAAMPSATRKLEPHEVIARLKARRPA